MSCICDKNHLFCGSIWSAPHRMICDYVGPQPRNSRAMFKRATANSSFLHLQLRLFIMHFLTLLSILAALFVVGTGASPAPVANETDVLPRGFTKQVTMWECDTCYPGAGCGLDMWTQDYGVGACSWRSTSVPTTFNKGDQGKIGTYGQTCTFFDDANYGDIDVHAGIGHMDCPDQVNIRCNKDDFAFSAPQCGIWPAGCNRKAYCQW